MKEEDYSKSIEVFSGSPWEAEIIKGLFQPPLRKLYRSRTERSIAGICGGLAAYFDSDPTLIRLLMLLLILFGGLSIWAYIILWIVIPEEPARKFNINSKNR